MSAACGSCGDAIIWSVFKKSGKRSPFDDREEITKEGEIRWRLVTWVDIAEVEHTHAVQAKVGELGRLNHFATCRQSTKWRKG